MVKDDKDEIDGKDYFEYVVDSIEAVLPYDYIEAEPNTVTFYISDDYIFRFGNDFDIDWTVEYIMMCYAPENGNMNRV